MLASPTPAGGAGNSPANAPAPNVSTDGIEMEEWQPEDDGGSHHISFTIWDFAGQEVCYYFPDIMVVYVLNHYRFTMLPTLFS